MHPISVEQTACLSIGCGRWSLGKTHFSKIIFIAEQRELQTKGTILLTEN